MKQEKNKLISKLISSFEKDCKSNDDLQWLKEVKKNIKEVDNELDKLSKKELIEKFKDDLIQLNNSNVKDGEFVKRIRLKLNEKRKRLAS